jgi:hypothetical protein
MIAEKIMHQATWLVAICYANKELAYLWTSV